jgi:alkyldihydroxyacetonephosphate synthase
MSPAADRWWGWGRPPGGPGLPADALALLRDEIGEPRTPPPAARLGAVELPDAPALPASITRAVGKAQIRTDDRRRTLHSAGRGYPDLIRLRSGRLDAAPDAVVAPADAEQILKLLAACSRARIAVVPFGGGTSVVGGVEPLSGEFDRVLSLDLRRLRGVRVDRLSLTARLGAGLSGPQAERALRARGLTLGHFPQSFERATVGGFAATRSAGQASSGYGRFDDLVTSIRLVAPAGELGTLDTPHTAAGPSLLELVVGSEGVLGAIPEVTVRVRAAPEARRYEGWMAADFDHGREVVRALAQSQALPDVIRLSDEQETRIGFTLSGTEGLARRALDAYLGLRRRRAGCLVICGWEGKREPVARRRAITARALRAGGAAYLGQAVGRGWVRGRYLGPYLRDDLLDAGVMAETLETAHTWSGLPGLYRDVRRAIASALEAQRTPGIVMCHLSHAYPDGASLYFTFLARQRPGRELAQWRAVKTAACDAIVAAGGTITHHHAVGRDHAPYMRTEVGQLGLDVLRSVKERLDPVGVMNPEKLLA